jgi:hypothetical protein
MVFAIIGNAFYPHQASCPLITDQSILALIQGIYMAARSRQQAVFITVRVLSMLKDVPQV